MFESRREGTSIDQARDFGGRDPDGAAEPDVANLPASDPGPDGVDGNAKVRSCLVYSPECYYPLQMRLGPS